MKISFGGAKTIVDATALPKWPSYYQAMRAGKTTPPRPALFAVNEAINEKIVLWRGDITALKIGAIVNAANSDLWAGGGICGAIHKAAGPRLEQACDKIGFCPTGSTVRTDGFKLPAANVFHSVGPTNRSPEALQSCYQTIMECCVKHKVRSVCMCCISTGIFGFPNEPASIIALSTVRRFLEVPENFAAIDMVVFCTFLIEDVKLYDEFTQVFFPVEASQVAPQEPDPEPSMYCASLSCWQHNSCAVHAADGAELKAGMVDDPTRKEGTENEEWSPSNRKEGAKRSASMLKSVLAEVPQEPELKSPKRVENGEVPVSMEETPPMVPTGDASACMDTIPPSVESAVGEKSAGMETSTPETISSQPATTEKTEALPQTSSAIESTL
jgi:O-acetyl-ADP-ribose deacetylase (regulator of RNase III)